MKQIGWTGKTGRTRLTYLLDSNVCTHIHQRTPTVLRRLSAVPGPLPLYISVVVQAELLYGAHHAPEAARPKLRQAVRALLARFAEALPVTPAVAEHYARVRAELVASGMPISDNDLWIAATALDSGLILVTDDAHFDRVPGLTVENWVR